LSKGKNTFVPGRTVAIAFAALAGSMLALLLWGKLKLVAGVPRTAYAVPAATAPQKPAKPEAPLKPAPVAKTTAVPVE
jgi:hypothetical protein